MCHKANILDIYKTDAYHITSPSRQYLQAQNSVIIWQEFSLLTSLDVNNCIGLWCVQVDERSHWFESWSTWSTAHVNLNLMNPVIWDGWMPCGSIITAGATCSGSGLYITGVPVVTQPFQSFFLVRLPMGWQGRCIWSMLGLQHVLFCAKDLTHVNMEPEGVNQWATSVKSSQQMSDNSEPHIC